MPDYEFTQYRRKQIAELRPYIEGEDVSHVSISPEDVKAGSPKRGDMIARNPKNHDDQWLVARAYFLDNFEALTAAEQADKMQTKHAQQERVYRNTEPRDGFVDDGLVPVDKWGPPTEGGSTLPEPRLRPHNASSFHEPFGYWVKHKYSDGVLLRKPSYIPKADENTSVIPLFTNPAPAARSGAVKVKQLDEDDYEEIVNAAAIKMRKATSGVRGQVITVQDSLDWWVMKETEHRILSALEPAEQAEPAPGGRAMNVNFPPHKAAMHITHNDHKSNHQSAREWVEENEHDPSTQYADWISEDEKRKAIEAESIWTLQWYPETPIGFQCVAASSFEALMDYFAQEDGR